MKLTNKARELLQLSLNNLWTTQEKETSKELKEKCIQWTINNLIELLNNKWNDGNTLKNIK